MKKNIITGILTATAYVLPAIAFGAPGDSPSSAILSPTSNLKDIIKNILGLFNNLIPLLIGAAMVVFLYGVLVFIAKSSVGNADGRKEGINFMVFGIIGIAVMVSVWGLVAFVTSSLGTTMGVPQFTQTPI